MINGSKVTGVSLSPPCSKPFRRTLGRILQKWPEISGIFKIEINEHFLSMDHADIKYDFWD